LTSCSPEPGEEILVRNRREGDRIALLGGGTRKLKEVFIDRKIPRTGAARSLWLRRAARFCGRRACAASSEIAVDFSTKRVLFVQYRQYGISEGD
jgi:tRNA(Ile)-lysidine synthetase-like protein